MKLKEEMQRIPSSWDMKPFKYVVTFGRGLAITKENLTESGVACLSYGDIHSKYPFEVNPKADPLPFVPTSYLDTDSKCLVSPGDIIFADTSEDIEGSGNFTQIVGDENIFAGYHTVVTRPFSGYNSRFLAYVLESEEFRNQIRSKVKGVKVYSITRGILGNSKVWFPDMEMQSIIASYLDSQTRRIDSLIAEKQTFINLIKEKRQALISHVVTKGLDSNVEMKDSGVASLGKIPVHWNLIRFRYVFSFSKGLPITKDDLVDEGVPCISYGEIHSKFGFEVNTEKHSLKCVDEKFLHTSQGSMLQEGDIVYADTSEDLEGSGNFTHVVSKSSLFAGYHTIICRQKSCQISQYLAYALDSESFRTQIRRIVKGVKVYTISQRILKDTFLWLPDIQEQDEIVSYLKIQTSKIDLIVSETEKSIELLKEHRTALISAAVTGKIDLRDKEVA